MNSDLSRSRAILIGNAAYRDPQIPDLPGAAACVQAMAELLSGELRGWPRERIVTFLDVGAPHVLTEGIVDAIADVEDTLLVYYVGHGMRTTASQLALPVGDTTARPETLPYTSLLYENLAGIIQDCPAATKLVILDCCPVFLIALSSIFTGSWSSLGRSPAYWALTIPFTLAAGWAVTTSVRLVSRPPTLRITPQLIELSYGRHRVRCDWAELGRVTIRALPQASPPTLAIFVYPRRGVRIGRGGAFGSPRPYKKTGWVVFCQLLLVRAGQAEAEAALAQFGGQTWDPAADPAMRPGLPAGRL